MMSQKMRYFVALFVLAGILLLARTQVSGAGVFRDQNENLLQKESQVNNFAEAAKPGTVKPPPGEVVITESGTYSIGGFCTYTVEFIATDISVHVSLEHPLPRPLPDQVHAVRQGCRVTYYQRLEGTQIDVFTAELGTSTICFSAIPEKNAAIYFYNVYAADPVWGPADNTQVNNGVACSDAGKSGVYVETFMNP